MRSRARGGSHWRPFPRTRPRAARASGLGSEGRWDEVRERWRSQLHRHRVRARACGGLQERGQGGRGGGVASSLFLFPRPGQLWRASYGHPYHGAISQMVKMNGRQSSSAEFRMSSERNEIACEGGLDGRNVRAQRRAVGLWFVVVLVPDLIFRVVRACVGVPAGSAARPCGGCARRALRVPTAVRVRPPRGEPGQGLSSRGRRRESERVRATSQPAEGWGGSERKSGREGGRGRKLQGGRAEFALGPRAARTRYRGPPHQAARQVPGART